MVYHDDGTFTISCSIRVNDAEFFAHTFLMIHESSSVLLMMQFFCVHITGHHESTVISRRRLTICCEVKVERKKETSFTFNAMRQKCPRHTVWKSPKMSYFNFHAKIITFVFFEYLNFSAKNSKRFFIKVRMLAVCLWLLWMSAICLQLAMNVSYLFTFIYLSTACLQLAMNVSCLFAFMIECQLFVYN